MAALRTLGGIFVAAAGVLAVAALVSQSSRNGSDIGARQGQGRGPRIEFSWTVPDRDEARPTPKVAMRGSELQTEMMPARHAHRHHAVMVAEHRRSKHRRHRSDLEISTSTASEGSAPAAPPLHTPTKNELSAVEGRLRNSVSDELYADFELFLYVSKAADGPLAQQMYVFRKAKSGGFDLMYNWPVSTGRDRNELNGKGIELSTFTPTGYFELDPHRFFRNHVSSQWHEPMPFAMFFDWLERGAPTGLAIHAATGTNIAQLGTRASAGCIRLAPEAAETLFTLIRSRYRGLTPQFAVDRRTGTMNTDGILLKDANGHVDRTEGYQVLVVIENYGGANLVAAMY